MVASTTVSPTRARSRAATSEPSTMPGGPWAPESGMAVSAGVMSFATVVTARSCARSTPLTMMPSAVPSFVTSAFE